MLVVARLTHLAMLAFLLCVGSRIQQCRVFIDQSCPTRSTARFIADSRAVDTHSLDVLGAFLCCALNFFDFVQEHPHVEAEPPSGATSVASKV